jgi:hypothetical protein
VRVYLPTIIRNTVFNTLMEPIYAAPTYNIKIISRSLWNQILYWVLRIKKTLTYVFFLLFLSGGLITRRKVTLKNDSINTIIDSGIQ